MVELKVTEIVRPSADKSKAERVKVSNEPKRKSKGFTSPRLKSNVGRTISRSFSQGRLRLANVRKRGNTTVVLDAADKGLFGLKEKPQIERRPLFFK